MKNWVPINCQKGGEGRGLLKCYRALWEDNVEKHPKSSDPTPRRRRMTKESVISRNLDAPLDRAIVLGKSYILLRWVFLTEMILLLRKTCHWARWDKLKRNSKIRIFHCFCSQSVFQDDGWTSPVRGRRTKHIQVRNLTLFTLKSYYHLVSSYISIPESHSKVYTDTERFRPGFALESPFPALGRGWTWAKAEGVATPLSGGGSESSRTTLITLHLGDPSSTSVSYCSCLDYFCGCDCLSEAHQFFC